MVIISSIKGDLLEAPEIICQQCNCVSILAHGLSDKIAQKYPWADIYKRRKKKSRNCTTEPNEPGTILIDRLEDKAVIHMFGQFLPGKPNSFYKQYSDYKNFKDGFKDRIEYFKSCLKKIDELNLEEPVAMPYKIGCGLAGGNWSIYEKMLQECNTKIILYTIE
jgi:hypothetical protein